MGAGENSWSRGTSKSAVEERGEIGIFGNKNFLKKEEGGGAASCMRAYLARRRVGLVYFLILILFF